MKLFPYYLLTLFILTSCSYEESSNAAAAPNIISWKEVTTDIFNKKIQQAYKENKSWVNTPELYIFNILDLTSLKNISYEYEADNIESPKKISIKLIRDGFLDDSIRGDIHKINLRKGSDGKWEVRNIKKSTACWRNESLIYSIKPCP